MVYAYHLDGFLLDDGSDFRSDDFGFRHGRCGVVFLGTIYFNLEGKEGLALKQEL